MLPPVPLGHTARTSFYVTNEGYDNLQLDFRLPADKVRMPLQLYFPEGRLVGIGGEDSERRLPRRGSGIPRPRGRPGEVPQRQTVVDEVPQDSPAGGGEQPGRHPGG